MKSRLTTTMKEMKGSIGGIAHHTDQQNSTADNTIQQFPKIFSVVFSNAVHPKVQISINCLFEVTITEQFQTYHRLTDFSCS